MIRTAATLSNLESQMPHEELAVSLVNDAEMTAVNEQFLSHSGSTDVITFDYRSDSGGGELIVCLDTAARAAVEHGTTVAYEVVLYIVHGMLHLVGFDDHSAADRKAMRAEEARIMELLQERWQLDTLFDPA
jgi:probable rRNA maturation factor